MVFVTMSFSQKICLSSLLSVSCIVLLCSSSCGKHLKMLKTLDQILKGTFLRSPENRFFVTYSIKNTSILSFEKNNLLADSCVKDTDQYRTSWSQTHTNTFQYCISESFTTFAET